MPLSTVSTPSVERQRPVEEMLLEEVQREYAYLLLEQNTLLRESKEMENKTEALRMGAVRLQQNAEVEEEHASNQLLRRLDGARREAKHCYLLLKEEEHETEEIASQIKDMRSQQTEVENQLEEQQEYLLMRLQRKLMDVAGKKNELERELMEERRRYLDVLMNTLTTLRGEFTESSAQSVPRERACGQEADAALQASQSAPVFGVQFTSHLTPSPADAQQVVVELEKRLNGLLQKHVDAMQSTAEMEKRCKQLSCKLHEIQDATFLDRARAVKLKEELIDAKKRLQSVMGRGMDTPTGDHSLLDESSATTTSSWSQETASSCRVSSLSLRDRTMGLLSASPLMNITHSGRQSLPPEHSESLPPSSFATQNPRGANAASTKRHESDG